MDWWMILGNVAVLALLTGMAEEYMDHPDWIAEPPALRWTANVVIGAVGGVVFSLAFLLATVVLRVGTQVVFIVLLVGAALWLLAIGGIRVWEFLTPKAEKRREQGGEE